MKIMHEYNMNSKTEKPNRSNNGPTILFMNKLGKRMNTCCLKQQTNCTWTAGALNRDDVQ